MKQPHNSGGVSLGIERLLALAASDEAFARLLLADRLGAVARAGVRLTEREERILCAPGKEGLGRMVAGVQAALVRRRFLGGAAAAMLGALAGPGCQRPREDQKPDPQPGSGTGGGEEPSRPVARAAPRLPPDAGEAYQAMTGEGTFGLKALGTITGTRPDSPGRSPLVVRPGPRVMTARPTVVQGALAPEIVRRIIRRHINEVKYCYQRELQGRPDLQGELTVRFTVAAGGEVTGASIAEATLDSAPLRRCVAGAVGRWLFPRPGDGQPAVAEVRFSFRNQ